MTLTHNIILLLFFCVTNTWARSQVDFESNNLTESDFGGKLLDNNEGYLALFKNSVRNLEKVQIKVYYETLCDACKDFEVNALEPVIDTMSLHLDVHTFPFGNARIIDRNGKPEVRCQHGPEECYGNKLHACALDQLEHTTALLYNICLMKSGADGSDDRSADTCGKLMDVDSEKIKECAKGDHGKTLLLYYGELSREVGFSYVPYVLVNDKLFVGDDFKQFVCESFVTPPSSCT